MSAQAVKQAQNKSQQLDKTGICSNSVQFCSKTFKYGLVSCVHPVRRVLFILLEVEWMKTDFLASSPGSHSAALGSARCCWA